MGSFFDTKIEFLKGVGPQRAELLNKELNIFTYGELIQHYPFRHEDRTRFYRISELHESMPAVQIRGKVDYFENAGEGSKSRLVAYFVDGTGEMELVWFKNPQWVAKSLKRFAEYTVFGKPQFFGGKFSIAHPEMELYEPQQTQATGLQPVYNLSEKLRKKHLDSKDIGKMIRQVLDLAQPHLRETLPEEIIRRFNLLSKREALDNLHFPKTQPLLERAQYRLKFE